MSRADYSLIESDSDQDQAVVEVTRQRQTFSISELSNDAERSKLNEFKWGALFGSALLSSQILLYWFFSATSSNSFGKELDEINVVPKIADEVALPTIISYGMYTLAAASVFGILNVVSQYYLKQKKPLKVYGNEQNVLRQTDNANTLYYETVANDAYKISWKQALLGATLFAVFAGPNYLYCDTFKDVGTESVKLLPDYGSNFFKMLNQNAGQIGFFMNLGLNQWFAFAIIKMVLDKFNKYQLINKEFNSDKSRLTKKEIGFEILKTLSISVASSLAFFFLALDDPDREKLYSSTQAALIPASALIVYGLALNTEGSMSLLNYFSQFWTWLNKFPQPFIDNHNSWKTYKGYVFGYLADNVKQFFREGRYLVGCYPEFLYDNDLGLPDPSTSEITPINIQGGQYKRLEEGEAKLKPKYTNEKLKKRVDEAITKLSAQQISHQADINKLHHKLFIQEKKRLEKEQKNPTTKYDIWMHGRVRQTLHTTWSLIGPVGLGLVLFGYYFMINNKLTERIYQPIYQLLHSCSIPHATPVPTGNSTAIPTLATIGNSTTIPTLAKAICNNAITENDALSRMLSFYLFSPFIVLVLESGYGAMSGMFTGFEHKIKEIYHTYQIYKGEKNADDFSYKERFLPKLDKKQIFYFSLGAVVFGTQIFAFLSTPASAGTAIYLLKTHATFFTDSEGNLNPFVASAAYWFAALFNSVGIAGFLSFGKQLITEFDFNSGKYALYQKNAGLFKDSKPGNFDYDEISDNTNVVLCT